MQTQKGCHLIRDIPSFSGHYAAVCVTFFISALALRASADFCLRADLTLRRASTRVARSCWLISSTLVAENVTSAQERPSVSPLDKRMLSALTTTQVSSSSHCSMTLTAGM